MLRPTQSYLGFRFLALLAILFLGIMGSAYADTQPKFLYAANSGSSTQVETFQVTATATCTSAPCTSTLQITGTIRIFASAGTAFASGSLYLSDSSDLASSPLAVTTQYPSQLLPISFSDALADGNLNLPVGPSPSAVSLALPFSTLSVNYSGGPFCTNLTMAGCTAVSTFTIGTPDMSASLLASSGGTPITGVITSGTLTLLPNTQGSNSVSGYSIDPTTGALTLLPSSPFATGSEPSSVAVDPFNKFVFVANQGSNNVSAFTINSTTGALTPVPGSPFAAGTSPDWLVVDPSGNYLYVANFASNNISAYTIDSGTGVLTPVSGSPFALVVPANTFPGYGPIFLTMDPLDRFLYVGYNYPTPPNPLITYTYIATIGVFTIDLSNGILTQESVSGGIPGPVAAVTDPSGIFMVYTVHSIYVTSDWGLSSAGINPVTGAPSGAGDGNGFDEPGPLAMHPSGKFVYEKPGGGAPYVTAYTLDDTTGNITVVPGSPYGDGCTYGSCYGASPSYFTDDGKSMTVDPSGKFLYVSGYYNDVSAFTINQTTGALSRVFGSPFLAGSNPGSIAIASSTSYTLSVTTTGNGSGTVSAPAGLTSGIDCGTTCSATYSSGTQVAATVTPGANSLFAGWSGPCTGTGPCQLTMNADTSLTANFVLGEQLSVALAGSGSGTVTSSDNAIGCASSGGTCASLYLPGASVSLTAIPATGSVFAGWSGACTGTNPNVCTVSMSAAESVTATFTPPPDFSLAPTSTSLTMSTGAQAGDVLTLAGLNGFSGPVTLTCAVTGPAPMPTCNFSQSSVTVGSSAGTSTLTITAPASIASVVPSVSRPSGMNFGLLLTVVSLLMGGILLMSREVKNSRRPRWLLQGGMLLALGALAGCGSGGTTSAPPAPQSYTVTVTATSGSIQHSTTVNVTVGS